MVAERSAENTERTNEMKLLGTEEALKRFGISRATLHRWRQAKRISFIQPGGKGGKLLYPADALEQLATARDLSATKATSAPKSISGPKPKWKLST